MAPTTSHPSRRPVGSERDRCARPTRLHAHHERRAEQLQRLTQVVAEVLAGLRDPGQLRNLMTTPALGTLSRRVGIFRSDVSPRVRIQVGCPAPRVSEVSAVVDCGGRHRALALRVSFVGSALLCTHLETDVRH